MRKALLIALLWLIPTIVAQAKRIELLLSVISDATDNHQLVVSYPINPWQRQADTIVLQNGQASMLLHFSLPVLVEAMLLDTHGQAIATTRPIVVDSTGVLSIQHKRVNNTLTIIGSESDRSFASYLEQKGKILHQKNLLDSKQNDEHVLDSKMMELEKLLHHQDTSFIKSNPGSAASAFIMHQYANEENRAFCTNVLQQMPNSVQESFYGQTIKARLEALVGGHAKQIVAYDLNGKTFDSYELLGKQAVLYSFWASWCKPCRAEAPILRELRNDYAPKGLAIVTVAFDDDSPDAWKKAIEKDSLQQFVNLLYGFGTEHDIGWKMGVGPIPAYVLVDTAGKITFRGNSIENDLIRKQIEAVILR